jgi:hypothetical protein
METIEKLKELRHYYLANRKKGHTTLMKEGTNNVEDKFILSYSKKDHNFLGVKPGEVVSWGNLYQLRGQDKPLVIDNGAMLQILDDTLDLIVELELKHQNLKRSISEEINKH